MRGARASQTPHKHKKIPTPPAPQRSHPAPTHGHHRAGPIPTPPEIKRRKRRLEAKRGPCTRGCRQPAPVGTRPATLATSSTNLISPPIPSGETWRSRWWGPLLHAAGARAPRDTLHRRKEKVGRLDLGNFSFSKGLFFFFLGFVVFIAECS